MKRVTFLAIALMTCALSQQAFAGQIFVDDSATGADDGSNWENAFNYLQDALEIALPGDEIRVAQGTYRPDQGDNVSTADRDAVFNLTGDVTLRGGYAGFGAQYPDLRDCEGCKTILSGDLAANDVEVDFPRDLLTEPTRADNSYSILLYAPRYSSDPPPVIEGFTIKGASNRALSLSHGDIIVTDCVFKGNAAEDFGGAVFSSNARGIFTRCSFIHNATGGDGGAVYSNGCGTCRSMFAGFIDCIFEGNYAGGSGGAVCSRSTTFTTAINCLFVGNAAASGGALYDDSYDVGALGSHLVNCTFAGNNCIAVCVSKDGYASLASCILWDNLCGTNGGIDAQLYCQIADKAAVAGSISVNYSCVEGWDGSLGGVGNLDADPQFASQGAWDINLNYTPGDYHLKSDSPCTNTGDPDFIAASTNPRIPSAYYYPNENMDEYIFRTSQTDLDAKPRVALDRVDMGPYEQPEPAPPVIYVDDSATGANDGSSWQDAFNYLQDALEAAQRDDEIRVAQGTYRPDQGDEVSTGDRSAAFILKDGVILKGGYKGYGAPDPDTRDCQTCVSLLSGDLAGNDAPVNYARQLLTETTRNENSYHIFRIFTHSTHPITIGGFTAQGATESAMHVDSQDCDVLVTNCTFRENAAQDFGAAIYLDSSAAEFTRCTFLNNAAATRGGAIYAHGCGTCRVGGAEAEISDCTFRGNYSGEHGGAIYTNDEATVIASDCLFAGNTAFHLGAALYENTYESGCELRNCTFSGNNCTAVYITERGHAELTSCILYNNICGTWAGQNAQIACQKDAVKDTSPGSAVLNYCLVEGWDGSLGGVGNFDADPRFVSPGIWDDNLNFAAGNYRLKPDSPCIDTGDPAHESSGTDLDGNPRLTGIKVDLGPYEYQPDLPPGGIIYVDDSATGANDGSSWPNAFNYLQDAIEASLPGYEIRVAQGTYKPDQGDEVSTGDRSAAFNLKSGVTLKGGYKGFGAPDPDTRDCRTCISLLSGDLANNDAPVNYARYLLTASTRNENTYHIIRIFTSLSETITIDGFTIQAAAASAMDVDAQNCDVVVTDCIFRSNAGGAVTVDSSVAKFRRCAFLKNAANEGGAIDTEGCGTCRVGGAEVDIFDCIFQGNYAAEHGGAVCTEGEATTIVVDSLFAGNTAGHLGAAIYEGSFRCEGTARECGTFLSNCTFTGNNCIAVYISEYSHAELTNCILHNNICGTWAGQNAQITLQQTAAKGTDPGSAVVNYCLVEGWDGSLGGIGNFDAEPRFVSPGIWDDHLNFAGGNYRLKPDSPCIDTGDPASEGSGTDLDGNPRLTGIKVDLGPYEYQPGLPAEGIIYVDDSATGANDGSSWQNAFNYLQDAIEASLPGYEIRVAQGTYKPDQGDEVSTGDREAAFVITDHQMLKGGYAGVTGPDPDARDFDRFETILSGDLAQNDAAIPDAYDLLDHPARADNSSHVVVIDSDGVPLVEGFTITGGNSDAYGGGLYINEENVRISDCVFVNNSSKYDGGAMAFQNGRVIFTRCSFLYNAAAEDGGAVHFDGCSTCRSMYGAFIDCAFIGNHANENGGAIFARSYTLTTAINSLFVGNTALQNGGAIYDSCYIGSYMTNCTFAGNNRSAIHSSRYGHVELTNCILWENAYGTSTGMIAQLTWETDEYHPDSVPVVNYSCIQAWNGSLGGVGNFGDDPRFVSPGSWDNDLNYTMGNYRLRTDSPCVNTGDPNYPTEPTYIEIPTGYYWPDQLDPEDYILRSTRTDLDVLPRVVQVRVDMGAYEHYTAALIAHWKLDESEGNTAEDSAGDNDGTLHGDHLWQPGRLNGALSFDGDGDYVNCSNNETFDLTSQITIAAWVQAAAVNTDWQTIIAKGDSAWRLSTAQDEYRYHFAVTGGPPWNYINGDTVVAAGEWHHVAGTYDGQHLRLYIDGAEDPAGPVPESEGITTNDFDVLIGENQERPGRFWDGKLDDVRIYNYALTSVEIVQLFAPSVIYVDKDAPGLNNGTSWQDAFNCLQDALTIAGEAIEIRVAQGRYTPDCGVGITPLDRDATFQLKNGVTIRGGYLGYGHPDPDICDFATCKTTLSGDLLGNDAEVPDPCRLADEPTRADNTRHIITADGVDQTAILEGLTIAGGRAEWSGGAGMYNSAASPTIDNCTFEGNFAERAGAMINANNSNPVLANCTFTENAKYSVEGGNGGAMINSNSSPTLTNCTFTRNYSAVDIPDHGGGYGGAIANYEGSPTITACTFTENIALCGGGAILNDYRSTPTITDCIFQRNIALGGGDRWAHGGAMHNDGGSPIVTNCTFIENIGRDGGAIHNSGAEPLFTNCIFSLNTARDMGGAVFNTYLSDATFVNCTFERNAAVNGNAIACYAWRPEHFNSLKVSNSIIWDGENSIWKSDDTIIEITYSDVQHGYPGLGNIDTDPCFVDASAGDYHLKSTGWRWNARHGEWIFDRETSRCIDAGNPGSSLVDEPLTVPDDPANEYGLNLRINMGAYGGTAQASMPPHDWAILADMNNDGQADFYDFACAGPYWLKAAPQQPCDLDRNGKADPADLEIFSIEWLKTTIWREMD